MFGACAGVGSLFAMVLPESKNKPMADTVDQLELLYGSRASSSSSIQEKGGVGSPLHANECDDVEGTSSGVWR